MKQAGHPNKHPWIGVLAILDQASDKPPSGGRGHKVILTRDAARNALASLVGMGVNVPSTTSHDPQTKVGVIEGAEISGDMIVVWGYIFGRDFPKVIQKLCASEEFGMSYEAADAHVEDMRQDVWRLTKVTFTGAAVLPRSVIAYKLTDFLLVD